MTIFRRACSVPPGGGHFQLFHRSQDFDRHISQHHRDVLAHFGSLHGVAASGTRSKEGPRAEDAPEDYALKA